MNREVSLKNLVNRIEMSEKFIKQHPEQEEMLRKHINKQKEYIVQCVLENSQNSLLNKITMA